MNINMKHSRSESLTSASLQNPSENGEVVVGHNTGRVEGDEVEKQWGVVVVGRRRGLGKRG